MDSIHNIRALGLMSSTEINGAAAALIETDGIDMPVKGRSFIVPYEEAFEDKIREIRNHRDRFSADELQKVGEELTNFHAGVVRELLNEGEKFEVIGFSGHILFHNPQEAESLALGSGQLLADLTGIKVVSGFRRSDLLAGGQGSPLLPVFHEVIAANLPKPVAVINIDGISRLTWLGSNGEMLAFDTGPGLAPVNDWVLRHGGQNSDYNGRLAALGQINGHVLAAMMRHKYFAKYPPKAFDRNGFRDKLEHLEALKLADGAATATALTAESIAYSMALYLPEMPKILVVCGSGADNPTLMRFLRQRFEYVEVISSAELGWRPDTSQAQAIAFLAARRLHHLPISFPTTTGVPEPLVGGEIYFPK